MTLYFEDNTASDNELDLEGLYRKVALRTLEYIGCSYDCEISLTIVDDEEIRRLNREYRGIDRVTDVLSFPLQEYEVPGDLKDFDTGDFDRFNSETGELMLGDIVICFNRIFSQAEEFGHSPEREAAFLIAHSMLHLLGFDHEEKKDEKLMFSKQEEILTSLGILR